MIALDNPLDAASVERFWSKVDKSGGPNACWPWIGGTRNRGGYGVVQVCRKKWIASRLALTLGRGEIAEGMWALHSCDNPPCCNPAHLFSGTSRDNQIDCVQKGRDANRRARAAQLMSDPGHAAAMHSAASLANRGEGQARSKLTNAAVREIRASDEHDDALAARHRVSSRTIRHIRSRKTWKHI